ncbi:single-stranded DNA-binding protein [Methylococcus capsulatus]|uniref:single-stranded DNA-binding protein n=1 Tax=Methylococcus capsulatus TaxID=414 RepID=UPI001C53391E|nr:single-stranded DNA-binding protein [Methylococcus capsulatus]QXP94367.1 single-stranded DNA-binding protein [Methylococcus capsulatus]
MTIHVLLSGELHRDPVQRTSASGKTFVTANVRSQSDGEIIWCSVITFSEDAQAELMRLRAGDALSVSGKAKLGVYQKGDEYRASLDVVASSVIALKPKPRERKPRQARTDGRQFDPRDAYQQPGAGVDPDLNYEVPFG